MGTEVRTAPPPGVVATEFVFEDAAFQQCHASTIVETSTGLVCAWFAGSHESNPDVGIWLSHRDAERWTPPVRVATGGGHPCWNPVLFQPSAGPLLLFFKVGPDPVRWWGMLQTSEDGGLTWSSARPLPDGILGPIKNKPIERRGGEVLCPSSTEVLRHSSTQDEGWRVHLEITADLGTSWERVGPINDGREFGAIQPSILTHPDGRLQLLCRSRQSHVTESWSEDGGRTWSRMRATVLPNPNSGTDAVTLGDGRHLLVYNHTVKGGPPPHRRERLNVALSPDGRRWAAALTLENEPDQEFSYPAVIQSSDGRVHITYTWKRRRVRHVTLDPTQLALEEMTEGRWPGALSEPVCRERRTT
jgi:predicted neuraminidase